MGGAHAPSTRWVSDFLQIPRTEAALYVCIPVCSGHWLGRSAKTQSLRCFVFLTSVLPRAPADVSPSTHGTGTEESGRD